LRVKAHHYLVTDDKSRSGTAVIGADELKDVLLVGGDIALFELDTSILEVGLYRPARRSAWLREHYDAFRHAENG